MGQIPLDFRFYWNWFYDIGRFGIRFNYVFDQSGSAGSALAFFCIWINLPYHSWDIFLPGSFFVSICCP